jgi:hypothetical protein
MWELSDKVNIVEVIFLSEYPHGASRRTYGGIFLEVCSFFAIWITLCAPVAIFKLTTICRSIKIPGISVGGAPYAYLT